MNRRALAAGAVLAALLAGCGGQGDQISVTALGSSSMERVMGALAEGYALARPEVRVCVEGGGSSAGVEGALRGTADLGLSSRWLTQEELDQGLEEFLLALDGIAVIVHQSNPVEELSVAQLGALFRGEAENWAQVGGTDGPVACIGREAGSGTRDGFEESVGAQDACVLAQELTSTGAVVEAVRSNPQAVGYASLKAVEGQEGIRLLTVDGTACTEGSVLDGSYPIRRPFVVAVRAGGPARTEAGEFLAWALSPAAAELIRLGGAVPASSQSPLHSASRWRGKLRSVPLLLLSPHRPLCCIAANGGDTGAGSAWGAGIAANGGDADAGSA